MNFENRDKIQLAILVAFIVIMITCLSNCTDKDGAIRILQQQGYTDIVITGGRFFGRSSGDVYCTGFEATSSNGTRVSGVVTKGWVKGSTIRFD